MVLSAEGIKNHVFPTGGAETAAETMKQRRFYRLVRRRMRKC